MTQIYSYSLAVFVPLGLIHCVVYPFNRLRLITTIGACMISLYYIYKETREYVVKYLNSDETTLSYMKMYTIASVGIFALLFRYYFMEP